MHRRLCPAEYEPSTEKRRSRLALWYGLALLTLFVAIAPRHAAAERVASLVPGGREVTVPNELLPWVPWVLDGLNGELCPKVGDATLCQWPARLALDVDARGARFALSVTLDADGWVKVPGSSDYWPYELEVDGKPAVVLAEASSPVTRLTRGTHRLVGRLRWSKAPETLSVPGAIAVVELTVRGRRVEFPRREESGAIWLQVGSDEAEQAPERAEIEVMRRIDDGVPLRMTTQLVLRVAGRTRELRLPRPLFPESRPLSVESPLPLRLDENGDLVLQARAGEHRVELVSLHPKPPAELALPKRDAPWPNQEIWVFNPDSAFRQVVPTGAPNVDPAQTNLPEEWKKLQAFVMTQGRVLAFATTRRGQPEPPPNQLDLNRQLWLDLDGRGFTVRDRVTGTMHRDWRLALPVAALGRALVSGADSLITSDATQVTGVELRRGAVDLTAEWRFERSRRDIPAVGWNSDVKSLSATLSVPPGWEVLHVAGADHVSHTWLSRWTLWGFFFVLVVAIAVARLLGNRYGFLALAALVLSHAAEDAPTVLWVVVIALLALLEWVPGGRFRSLLRLVWLGAALALAVSVTEFAVEEVRHAFYPMTNRDSISAGRLEEVASTMQALDVESADKEGGTGVRAKAEIGSISLPRRAAASSYAGGAGEPSMDPDAVIQTGPGLPSWTWRSIQMNWTGPVHREQRLQLWLLAPFYSGLLGCLRAALVGWLAYALVSKTAYGAVPPSAAGRRRGIRPLVAAAAALFALVEPKVAVAAVDEKLLEELKSRLTRGPDCESCVQVSSLDLGIQDGTMRALAEVHAGAIGTYQIPGPARSWTPASVRLDGRPAVAVLLHSDGYLHVRVEPGRHRIEFEGPVQGQDLTLTSGTAPRFVTVAAKGWSVDGLRDGHIEGSLHFSAEAERTRAATDVPRSHVALPPWLEVTRTLEAGVTFRMTTNVVRVSPKGDPISVRYPLLPGEEITEAGAIVERGQLVINLDRDQTEAKYKSVLSARAKQEFVATPNRPWTEEWRFRCSSLWHCDFSGIAPYQQLDEGTFAPRFRPWPAEILNVSFDKPAPAQGNSRTIDRVVFEVTPGQRLLDASLSWTERVSKGETEVVQLPTGAVVQGLTINGKEEPIRVHQQRLELALHPGVQNVLVTFYCPGGLGTWFKTPSVTLGGKAVNAELKVVVPADRWLLLTQGPSWGPKVLLWTYLILVLTAGYLLSKLPKSPLRLWQWWLLGIGLSQVPVVVALTIASWFFVVVLRGAWEPSHYVARILFRLCVIGWTLVFLGCLTGAVYDGLVRNPDMLVEGGSGSDLHLRWYVDRVSGALPTALVVSVPLLVWRLLNLLWALWLAASLVRWLRWGFTEFSRYEFWPRPVAAPRTPQAAVPTGTERIASPPDVAAPAEADIAPPTPGGDEPR